ncbi:hypothetical protein BKA61DRAFT_583255 [Leptodontidium sp. MPI-SDFR-AT-0119]|nr:hypothetical protein BKA61DRAFT_583255 [Leptodontidium sp. MPI-SDFR-AT-0119]
MADKIEAQNEKINNLQRQLNNQAFLQPFLTLGKGEELPLNQGQIRTYHAKMRRDFGSLSFMNYFQHPGAKSACIDSQELSELKSKVGGDMDQYPIGLVIQSLTGAAICDWVFNEKMQCTAMMNTPLLEGYKHHLSTICGETALRNVDLAAHQWVINEELHFQEEFIPRTATKLTERLLGALGPFLKNKNKSDAKLHIRLKSIFCAALNIKSFRMIGKHVFEFIWPAQNSICDKDCMMEEESSEGTTYDQTSLKTEAKKVVLALVPGLRVFKYDRKLVDYSGFMKGDEEGLEQCCIVAQAVVVAH